MRKRQVAPTTEQEKALAANFDTASNQPGPWWLIGWNLLASSDILAESLILEMSNPPTAQELSARLVDAKVRGATLMLRGCAVECLLKAFYVDGGNELTKDGNFKQPEGVPSHDLVGLAKAAAFSISPDEQSLLKLLGYWIEQGRYPTMTTWSKRPEFAPPEKPLAPNWDLECESLWGQLRERFRREGKRLAAKE